MTRAVRARLLAAPAERTRGTGPWGTLRDALHAEWTKTRTLAGPGLLLLAAVALTGAVGVAAAAGTRCPSGHCTEDPTRISLTGLYLGQALVALVGVAAVGGEYGTGMIRATLAATPRRTAALAAKAAVLAGLVAVAGVLAVGASLPAGRLILTGNGIDPAHGYPAMSLADGAVLRAAGGSVLYLVLVALLALGVATAVRESALAVAVVLALLYLFPIVGFSIGDPTVERHIQQVGPMTAGLSITNTADLRHLPIGPWAGLGVLAAWAVGALLTGGVALRLRDAP